MFEVHGYKKFEDKQEKVGEYNFSTKRYQKRVDILKDWEGVLLCQTNDKLFVNITESQISGFPVNFSVELIHEGWDDVWVDLKLYSLTKEQMEDNLHRYEQVLKKMWIVFTEDV